VPNRLPGLVKEHLRPERRLRRAGLGLVLVCLVVITAYGVSQVFGEERAATPGIDNATGLYRQSAIHWPLCTVFILLGAIILFALMMEASS